jgi:YVTN family beta-propeller protein
LLLPIAVLLLLLTAPMAQAGPTGVIGNAVDGTVTIIDTAVSVTSTASPTNVTVTATIPLADAQGPIAPVAGIAANPVRAEMYIAGLTSDGLSVLIVFGTNPPAQIAQIPLSVFEPIGVAVNPAGTRVYVSGGLTDNIVSVVNVDTRAEIGTIVLHATDAVGPYGLVVHPSQPRLYVGNSNAGTISVINTTTNAIVTTITVDPCPNGCAPNKLALSPDGSRLYVTDDFADVVWVINTANNTIVTAVSGVLFPEGVAAHPDGSRIYVANMDPAGAGRLTEISTATNTVGPSVAVGGDPIGVAVDPTGSNVLVLNYLDDTLTVLSTADLTNQVTLPVGGAPATFGQFIAAELTGSIQFSSANYSVNEPLTGTVNAPIVVTRTGAPGATIVVHYATSAGTATAGVDYTETSGDLTFGPTTTSLTFNVPVKSDATAEADETVHLTLGPISGLAALGTPSEADLTIKDVSGGSVQFSSATYSVNEAGPGGAATAASIVVTRTGGTAGGVTVDYTTRDLAPPQAQGGVDYVVTSGTLTFNAGVTSLTFTVPILNDTLPEGNEGFLVVLSNPSAGARLGSPSTSTVTILDDEVVLQFDATAYSVSEDGGKATITVERSGPLGSTVTVQYATSNGSATGGATATTPGADYVITSGTLTFGPTVTRQTFTVTIVNDFVIEPDETVTLTLSNPGVVGTGTPPVLGPRNPAILTITNDDKAGSLEFSAGTYTVSEAAGAAAIVVTRSGGLGEGVTVTFSTGAGTATPGADYTETTTTLTFAGGEASKTVLVPIINDSLVEPNETVNLTLSSPGGGGVLGPRSTAVLTIISDDQPGVVEFSAATYSVNEAAGPARIVVIRTGGNASNVTVDYATSDGTATAPGDYAATSGTLTFGAGVSSLTFTIPIVNDNEGEGPETVNLTLSNPGGGATMGAKKTAVLTIVDDEPSVQFAAAEFLGMEGTVGGVITVTRTGPLTGTATVRYAASDDTAVMFRDYSPTAGVLTFAPNIASKTFTVPITDGSILEPDEFVTLTLSSPSGAVLGNQKTARLRIRDNDPGTLKLSADKYSVKENVVGQKVVVSVLRTGSLNATTTVLFQTIDGTATGGAAPDPGVDYISVSRTLTFTPGVTKIDVPITIVDDTLAEGDETFVVRLGGRDPVTGAVTGITNGTVNPRVLGEAVVTIVDDDKAGTVQFKQAAFSVTEPAGGPAFVEITVTRTGGTAGPATVAFATADGTATAGEDYLAVTGTLTFAFNETTKTFQVPVLGDSVIEGTETVRLTLSNPTGGLTLGPQSTAILSILESTSVLQFSQLVYTVSESTSTATITVVRSGSLAGVATVKFRTVDGTATAPADYGSRSGVLTFPAGSSTPQTFTIPIVNDDLFEGDETVNLVLSDPVGAVLGQLSTSTLVITDNDPPGIIAFSSAVYSVSESAGTAKITVVRTNGTAQDITVQYMTEDITATSGPAAGPGVDYMTTSGTLTFKAKETSKTFDVKIFNDDVAEAPETVRLRLLNPGGGATLGLAEAILTITSDDAAGVIQFSAPVYNVTEDAANTATIVVTRTGGTAPGVTVAYQTNDGTATSGSDYTATAGVLSFGAGVTSLTFTIPILGDDIAEGDEAFTVTLSNPTGGAKLGSPSTATVNIFDDEQVIQFSSAAYSVDESKATAEITIVRSGSIAAAATVHFKTGGPGDTATPGPGPNADYTPQDITVTFPANSAVQKVLIPIVNDTLVEGNETVTLTLDTPTGGAVIGPRGTATLTIVDNDLPGIIRFEKPIFTVQETATGPSVVAAINITRALPAVVAPGQALGSGVTVDFSTQDGSAIGGGAAGPDIDYASQSTTLTFAVGETKKTVNVTVFNDSLVEGDETIVLKLSNPTRGATLAPPVGAAPGAATDATLVIVSDDRPGVFQFSQATYTATEGQGVTTTATLTVNRVGTAASLGSAVTVDYTITGGTALIGSDYALNRPGVGGGRLTFGAGVTSQTFTVTILPDSSGEGPETIVFGLQNPTAGATLGTPSSATVTINDAQTAVSFTSPILSTPESGIAQVTIVRTGPVAGITSTVKFTAVTGIFVTPGVDFTPVSNLTVTFPPGVTKQTVTVPILSDTLPELNESISLVLFDAVNAVIGPIPVASLFILDDDPGTFRFTSPVFSVKEGEPVVVIGVTRVGTTNELAQPATATVTFDDGTAVNGRDYMVPANRSLVLTFDPNVTTQTLVVPIIDNEIKDGTRSFTMGILATAPAVTSAGTRATVTIQDND